MVAMVMHHGHCDIMTETYKLGCRRSKCHYCCCTAVKRFFKTLLKVHKTMHQEYMENIRADLDYLNLKISHLSGNRKEVHSACKRLEKNVNLLNLMLFKERVAWAEEREKMEEAMRLKQGLWKTKEMCLVSHIRTLEADLKAKDLQLNWTRRTSLSRVRADSSKDRETEDMIKVVQDLKKERLENKRIRVKNDATMKHIQKLEEANQQLEDELAEKDEEIEKLKRNCKASKTKVEKIRHMSDELRSKNEEVHSRYRAMLKQKMEKLERERELIRGSVNELEEVLPVMVMRKQRLMQELKEKCLSSSETMSKKERKEWKKMQRKREKEAEREMKAEKKRQKELLKAVQKMENKKEKKSFWRRLQCWRK